MVVEFMLTWSGYLESMPWLMGISYALPYLLGPTVVGCLYFRDKPAWRWSHALHLLPFLLALGWSLPFLLLGGGEKTDIYEASIVTETYFHEWVYIRQVLLKALHMGAYAILAWYAFSPKRRVGQGLRWCLSAFVFLLIVHACLLLADLPGYAITYCVLVVGFGGLAIWLQYELSRPSPTTKGWGTGPSTAIAPAAAPTKIRKPGPKYEKSGLDEIALAAGAQQLTLLMENEKPFLDTGLRLRDLAEKSKLPEHHLSQILNVHFGRKFPDYVNAYRVEYARELLRKNPAGNSILAVAFATGFNSKNSFNRAFRKFTGQSPTEFKKNGPIQPDGAKD